MKAANVILYPKAKACKVIIMWRVSVALMMNGQHFQELLDLVLLAAFAFVHIRKWENCQRGLFSWISSGQAWVLLQNRLSRVTNVAVWQLTLAYPVTQRQWSSMQPPCAADATLGHLQLSVLLPLFLQVFGCWHQIRIQVFLLVLCGQIGADIWM